MRKRVFNRVFQQVIMRKVFAGSAVFLSVTVFLSVLSLSDQLVSEFKIGFMVDKVFLRWKSLSEETVQKYDIERSFDNQLFTSIGKMEPKGDYNEYTYIDKNIFKANQKTFYYRLKIIKENDTFLYSKTLQLTPRVSGAKQTWGSIKAIFH